MSQDFGWLNQQGDKPEPRLERIATLWRMRGASGRNIECAAFRTETGMELRTMYSPEEIIGPLYRGEVVWNRTKKRDRWGQSRRSARPESEWFRMQVPEIAIVSADLWKAAQHRLNVNSARFTASSIKRRRYDLDSQYLLPGFARCGMCGGGMGVIKRTHGRHRVGFYGCIAYQKRGTTVCANNLLIRMESIDKAVLATIGGDVLKPKIIDAVIAGVKDAMKPANITRETVRRKREIGSLEQEIGRLTEAIASSSTPVPTLLEALQTRQRRRDELIGIVESGASAGKQRDIRAMETAVRDKLSAWRSLLTRQTQDGRALLREILEGPIRFMPDGKMYRFHGKAALGKLLAGTASNLCGVPGGHRFHVGVDLRTFSGEFEVGRVA